MHVFGGVAKDSARQWVKATDGCYLPGLVFHKWTLKRGFSTLKQYNVGDSFSAETVQHDCRCGPLKRYNVQVAPGHVLKYYNCTKYKRLRRLVDELFPASWRR